ncbi:MAG: hypothetical protein NC411_06670 [Bacteroides sp.]|nr:hypothetical protein [Bacteroides sp.]
MTARTTFLLLECVIYILTLILFALKMANVETLILMTLAFVCFIGLYVTSAPRSKEK